MILISSLALVSKSIIVLFWQLSFEN
jgi:hypothetical protein